MIPQTTLGSNHKVHAIATGAATAAALKGMSNATWGEALIGGALVGSVVFQQMDTDIFSGLKSGTFFDPVDIPRENCTSKFAKIQHHLSPDKPFPPIKVPNAAIPTSNHSNVNWVFDGSEQP